MRPWLPKWSIHDASTPEAAARCVAITWFGIVFLFGISRLTRGREDGE